MAEDLICKVVKVLDLGLDKDQSHNYLRKAKAANGPNSCRPDKGKANWGESNRPKSHYQNDMKN